MTAVADVQTGVVRASVEIAAPPEAVFRALTDPTELPRWWGSADAYRTNDWKVDLRPGRQVELPGPEPAGRLRGAGRVPRRRAAAAARVHLGAELGAVPANHHPLHARAHPRRHTGERGPPRLHRRRVRPGPRGRMDPGARVARRPLRRHPRGLDRALPPGEGQEPEEREPRRRRAGGGGAAALCVPPPPVPASVPVPASARPPPVPPSANQSMSRKAGSGQVERVGQVRVDVGLHQEVRERRGVPVRDRRTRGRASSARTSGRARTLSAPWKPWLASRRMAACHRAGARPRP